VLAQLTKAEASGQRRVIKADTMLASTGRSKK
jgi:hypothetical protein